MFPSAFLFAGFAVLGALVGLERIGQPINGQSLTSFGWALCINAAAISLLLIFFWVRKAYRSVS